MRNRRSSASSSASSDSPASTARASDCALVNHPPRRLLGRVAPGSYKSPTRFLAGSVALPASAPGSCKLPTRSLAGGGLGGGCGPGGRMLGAGFDVMVPNRRGGTISTALKASTDVPVLHCCFSIGAARALPIGKLLLGRRGLRLGVRATRCRPTPARLHGGVNSSRRSSRISLSAADEDNAMRAEALRADARGAPGGGLVLCSNKQMTKACEQHNELRTCYTCSQKMGFKKTFHCIFLHLSDHWSYHLSDRVVEQLLVQFCFIRLTMCGPFGGPCCGPFLGTCLDHVVDHFVDHFLNQIFGNKF